MREAMLCVVPGVGSLESLAWDLGHRRKASVRLIKWMGRGQGMFGLIPGQNGYILQFKVLLLLE